MEKYTEGAVQNKSIMGEHRKEKDLKTETLRNRSV